MFHVFSSLLTTIALVGHFLWHMPQNIHFDMSIIILPLAASDNILGPKGYLTVAGFLNKLFRTIFAIIKNCIVTSYEHVTYGASETSKHKSLCELDPHTNCKK